MACFRPVKGYPRAGGGITWSPSDGYTDRALMTVPCGQCLGCRLERGRQWTVRLMHEASLHQQNCFITLTYSDEHVPKDGSLNHRHFQDFIRKFRRAIAPRRVSYFMCGEYGESNARPHYHALIFGYDFTDQEYSPGRVFDWASGRVSLQRQTGARSSKELEGYWQLGYNAVGAVTPQSAGYVARYCLKKVTGVLADEHYRRVNVDTGEVYWVVPEYAHMSSRPAIGKEWFARFGGDVVGYDGVFVEGERGKPPRYYDKLRKREDREELRRAKVQRVVRSGGRDGDLTPERLAVRERVAQARVSLFQKRKL